MRMVAVIDPYVEEPAWQCYNALVENFTEAGFLFTYHAPAHFFGLKSLLQLNKKIDAYIILGSGAHVFEQRPWQAELVNLSLSVLEAGTPLLGVCYGHQLLAATFGAEVGFIDSGSEPKAQKGFRTVTLSKTLAQLPSGTALKVIVSHKQIVKSLGPNLESLAQSELSPNEIIRHKKFPFFGIQAHPEASAYFCSNNALLDTSAGDLAEQCRADGRRFVAAFLEGVKKGHW